MATLSVAHYLFICLGCKARRFLPYIVYWCLAWEWCMFIYTKQHYKVSFLFSFQYNKFTLDFNSTFLWIESDAVHLIKILDNKQTNENNPSFLVPCQTIMSFLSGTSSAGFCFVLGVNKRRGSNELHKTKNFNVIFCQMPFFDIQITGIWAGLLIVLIESKRRSTVVMSCWKTRNYYLCRKTSVNQNELNSQKMEDNESYAALGLLASLLFDSFSFFRLNTIEAVMTVATAKKMKSLKFDFE